MATSDESSKPSKQNDSGTSTGTGSQAKRPSTTPVVPSKKIEAGDATVSRIPPSRPIESGIVGTSDGKTVPAERKPVKESAAAVETGASAKPAVDKTPAPADTRADDAGTSVPPVAGRAMKDSGGNASPPTPPSAPPASPPTPRQNEKVVVRKTGFWPVALGGVVAAGLGAAAAIYALPQLSPAEPAAQIDSEAIQADAVNAATEAARSEAATIRDEAVAAATEAAGQAGAEAGTEAAQQALAEMSAQGPDTDSEMQAALQSQADRLAALETAIQESNAASAAASSEAQDEPADEPSGSNQPSAADLAGELQSLRQQIEQQQQVISELSARPQVDPQAIERVQALAENAEQMRSEIETAAAQAQDSLSEVQSEAQAATQRAQAVASVAALGAALERGGSPAEAVQQLEDAGVEVPEPLAQDDLPTLDQIQMGYDAAARTALRASLEGGMGEGGALGAVGNFLRVQTGARSVEPREGDDPDAVLSRAGALVQQGDLPAALEELNALPQPGLDAMSDWIDQTEAYLAAEAALNDVAQSLN